MRTIAVLVLALFLISMMPAQAAYQVGVGGTTNIKFEINETEESQAGGTEDTGGNEDEADDETADEAAGDTSEEELDTYAKSRIKDADAALCEKRLVSAFPNASRGRIIHVCENHIKALKEIAASGVSAKKVVMATNQGYNRCVAFLQQNKEVGDPNGICEKIVKKELICVDYLNEHGIVNPESKCDTILKAGVVGPVKAIPAIKFRLLSQEMKDKAENLPDEAKTVLKHLPVVKQKEILNSDNPRQVLSKFKVQFLKPEDAYRKREIAKEKLKEAERKYQQAKEKFSQANEFYKEKKDEFLDAKEKVKECKGSDTEECQKLNEEIIEKAKEFLSNAVDKAIEHLRKIEEKVNAADDLPEGEAGKILAEIAEDISALGDARSQVEAASTKEEVEAAAKAINQLWKGIKIRAEIYAGRIIHASLGEIIQRSIHLENKLQCSLEALPEDADTTKVDAMVEEFSSKVESAKVKNEKAKELFLQAKENSDPSLVKQSRDLVNQAHKDLKDAHAVLKDIVREIKSLGGEITSCEDEEEQVAVVTEEGEEE